MQATVYISGQIEMNTTMATITILDTSVKVCFEVLTQQDPKSYLHPLTRRRSVSVVPRCSVQSFFARLERFVVRDIDFPQYEN